LIAFDRLPRISFVSMKTPRYLAVTGGIGGAKLALGLSKILTHDELAFVVNTADDFLHLGMHVSPDVDTLVYTLAEENNPETGWGRRDESWTFMAALAELGGETWFRLGDKDLAMNVQRTRHLEVGLTLSQVTAILAESLGVRHPILPMSNDPVRTRVQTPHGELEFQHYFVRDHCEPAVSGFRYEGVANAGINPDIGQWLGSGQLAGVILCPSNPFVSIDPILSVPGFRAQLQSCSAPVIAVSPIVGGEAIKGPLAKMMREMSVPNKATWVAQHYRDFLDGFVLDTRDAALATEVQELGMVTATTNTVMQTLDDRIRLARTCLEFASELRDSEASITGSKERP